jgi:hypothetical protein
MDWASLSAGPSWVLLKVFAITAAISNFLVASIDYQVTSNFALLAGTSFKKMHVMINQLMLWLVYSVVADGTVK